jgi:hypothetical protein
MLSSSFVLSHRFVSIARYRTFQVMYVCSLPQKVSDFSTISKANNTQFLWQGAYECEPNVSKSHMFQKEFIVILQLIEMAKVVNFPEVFIVIPKNQQCP